MIWETQYRKSQTVFFFSFIILFFLYLIPFQLHAAKFVELDSPGTEEGYLAYLLINENPFPGEEGYVSMNNSKTGMVQILWVLNDRLRFIPKGYTQLQVANIKTDSIVGIITAEGQCEGFHLDADGKPAFDYRVKERIDHLVKIANSGKKPGKFAKLLNFAKDLSKTYVEYVKIFNPNIFQNIFIINRINVTGRAYSWMTDKDYYSPGGTFVAIPDSLGGSQGGNRFYTLKEKK